ncbi:hypothetical protein [Mycobacterium sp.]|uniref:hypothetical protein n=1 Tax=Mycobacterium sp. TaxID=1785 RepID=UPI003BAD4EDF
MTVGEIEKDLSRTAASYYSAARIRRVHADKIKSKIPSKQADSAALKRLAEEEHQKGALNSIFEAVNAPWPTTVLQIRKKRR